MALTRTSTQIVVPLTLAQIQAHLRLEPCGSPPTTPDDDLLLLLGSMATSELEGVDGWLGRALIDQDWLLTLSSFPSDCAPLWAGFGVRASMPIPLPLTSPRWSGGSPAFAPIISFEYVATDGTVTTMVDGVDYELITDNDPMYLRPLYGKTWPSTREQLDAVRIRYTAGYGPDPDDVPAIIRSYMLVRIGQLYEFRELVLSGTTIADVPFYRDTLENVRLRGYK